LSPRLDDRRGLRLRLRLRLRFREEEEEEEEECLRGCEEKEKGSEDVVSESQEGREWGRMVGGGWCKRRRMSRHSSQRTKVTMRKRCGAGLILNTAIDWVLWWYETPSRANEGRREGKTRGRVAARTLEGIKGQHTYLELIPSG